MIKLYDNGVNGILADEMGYLEGEGGSWYSCCLLASLGLLSSLYFLFFPCLSRWPGWERPFRRSRSSATSRNRSGCSDRRSVLLAVVCLCCCAGRHVVLTTTATPLVFAIPSFE